ncbi:MAG: alpha/beta hydrolase [Desulfovibrionaceae bacterium]|nr:alpha/beta hydrolase [Desulfovibrionaceae bacterium]
MTMNTLTKSLLNNCRRAALLTVAASVLALSPAAAPAADMSRGADNFYVSKQLASEKVQFRNMFGMTLTGTLCTPKNLAAGKHAAVIVGHPHAAVRQQAASLYAQKMADAGFVTLCFDQAFWGESGASPRGSVLPDIYAESFSAAVDFLGTKPFVDRARIGVIGVCGSGGYAISAAKIDTRIRALATVSMYDMGEYYRTGLNRTRTKETRNRDLERAASARWEAVDRGEPVYGIGQDDGPFPEAAESNDFYQTERGNVPSNDRRTTPASYAKFMNFYPFNDIASISPRSILFVVGEIAPSRCYTDTAYALADQPKELVIVPGANRIDLYDRTEIIPWDKLAGFFRAHLGK